MPQNNVVTEIRNILHKNRKQKLHWLSAQDTHTGSVTKRKNWFFLVRQVNKSGWYNYFLFKIFFFLYTVREIYSARHSLEKFQAPSLFGLCAPCLPKTVLIFHAFTNDARSKWCTGTRTTVLFATAWLCTEKSPVAAHFSSAAFSRLWVLHESGTTQELKHQEIEILEAVTLFHLFYWFVPIACPDYKILEFYLLFYQLFLLFFYSSWNIN